MTAAVKIHEETDHVQEKEETDENDRGLENEETEMEGRIVVMTAVNTRNTGQGAGTGKNCFT